MFEWLGKIIERRWQVILILWGLALLAALGVHREWYNRLFGTHIKTFTQVAKDGEFAFLPPQMQSLLGEQLLAKAFPKDLYKSSVVIVVRRLGQPLQPEDETFIEDVLKPRLEAIQDELKLGRELEIVTFKSPKGGQLLVSEDQEASLVIMPLNREFLEWGNVPVITRIEKLLDAELSDDPVTHKSLIPTGLGLAMSGSATVGRDMLVAGKESASATERATIGLVVVLLLVIYQSPVLAAIPLFTVAVSVVIAKALVVLLAQIPGLDYRVFFGMETYITVVTYGTGVDYCLFLIARYKEELDRGLAFPKALTTTLTQVGAAVTASALTVICGIGMMVFAQFGKFREAGIGISLSLSVGLIAALTLAPALLRLCGRWAFWPRARTERIPAEAGSAGGTTLINRLGPRGWVQKQWERVGILLLDRPGQILSLCFAIMLPFAILGIYKYEYLSYGLLSELPLTKKSVEGAKAVQSHFPAGYAGPLTILVRDGEVGRESAKGAKSGDESEPDEGFFSTNEGSATLGELIGHLIARLEELGIADIRYFEAPLGLDNHPGPDASSAEKRKHTLVKRRAKEYYVSTVPGLSGHVARVDVVFKADPFDRESIQQYTAVETTIANAVNGMRATIEADIKAASDIHDDQTAESLSQSLDALENLRFNFVGPTASIRDLKTVTDHDQIKIDLLVLTAVFLILVILLRKPAISLYLIISVFFSYFVTLGVTFAFYYLKDPVNFSGLDWKVPMFLFTILMAIGEDYNIFLMTRIEEEQKRHGPVEGIRIAMLRTGTIISSCGIIMAGTFLSLLFGTLVGMQQLGFALAFGVLLDTFVVRPLLVPAYLILLYRGKFGSLTRFLGHSPEVAGDLVGHGGRVGR
jgi:RND superfamily putative drug exporter